MTTASPTSARPRAGQPPAPTLKRAVAWGLHILVTLLALFSLFTNRFNLWIDLRMLGPAAIAVKILWTATTLLVPLCAGPRLTGLAKPRWINRSLSPSYANLFLIPTYFLIACLIANTIYFFVLLRHELVEPDIPMPLVAAVLLGAWTLSTREWLRTAHRLPESTPTTRTTQFFTALFALPTAAFLAGFFLLHCYANPPTEPVDLAVVLGYGVHYDGVASPILAARTQAAIDLYNRGFAKHILLSGAIDRPQRLSKSELNETSAMYDVCKQNNIPDSALTLDPVGINTRATAYNTKMFMQANHYQTVAACSSDWHLFRTAMSFHEVGINAYTVVAPPTDWICADPHDILREMLGVIVYKLDPNYRLPKAATMKLANPRVVVRKSANMLTLYDGDALFKTYPCITGGNPGDKTTEGDRRTPIGLFHIVYKNPQSKFHLSLGLDYPNAEDADRGLKAGLISQQQYNDILAALHSDLSLPENQQKLWYTPLGGEIFLHGHAEGRTGTAGCIALSNEDIEELYAILPLNTPVEIRP